jgi:hypothetical protein
MRGSIGVRFGARVKTCHAGTVAHDCRPPRRASARWACGGATPPPRGHTAFCDVAGPSASVTSSLVPKMGLCWFGLDRQSRTTASSGETVVDSAVVPQPFLRRAVRLGNVCRRVAIVTSL